MEMPITILNQSPQAPVSQSPGKLTNAKQADADSKVFNSTLNKALAETEESEKAAVLPQQETSVNNGEDKLPEGLLGAVGIALVQVNPVINPVIADMILVSGETEQPMVVSTLMDTDNMQTNTQGSPLIAVQTEVPLTSTSPTDLPEMSAVQAPPSETAQILSDPFQAVLDGNRPELVSVSAEQPLVSRQGGIATDGAENATANLQLNAQLADEPVSTMQIAANLPVEPTAVSTEQIAANPADGLTAASTVQIVDNPLKTEQADEPKGMVLKETLTAATMPATGNTFKQSADSQDFNTDNQDDALMPPLTMMQRPQIDQVNKPFSTAEAVPSLKDQVLQAIAQKVRLLSNGNQQTMQIQLKPEHLGPLNVQIAVDNGNVTAKFQTDNPQVKQLLEASLNQLKQDLQAQGFKVQDVAVSIAQQGMSFSDFSRRSPQFTLIKSKRNGEVGGDSEEQVAAQLARIENYGDLTLNGVDYKI